MKSILQFGWLIHQFNFLPYLKEIIKLSLNQIEQRETENKLDFRVIKVKMKCICFLFKHRFSADILSQLIHLIGHVNVAKVKSISYFYGIRSSWDPMGPKMVKILTRTDRKKIQPACLFPWFSLVLTLFLFFFARRRFPCFLLLNFLYCLLFFTFPLWRIIITFGPCSLSPDEYFLDHRPSRDRQMPFPSSTMKQGSSPVKIRLKDPIPSSWDSFDWYCDW